ncbi:MAG: branched-chain amino acid transaminase [Gemmatimonadota bacterium]|nr:branched-chain amino acid transaminase [Gemmatimonadota bacterium]
MAGKLEGSDWIWSDGKFIQWENATVHLLSLAVQFGSSLFEGIRCYDTSAGPSIFRLDAHIRRLIHSCKIYRMEPKHTHKTIAEACSETVRKNDLGDCYIRPMVLRGYGAAGLDPTESPIETAIAAWPWGAYLGEDALKFGVDVCVSTWNRPAPNTFPSHAKAAGHYNNAQLIKMEAIANGYAEAIVLGTHGRVSEGGGQNLFLIQDGVVVTPELDGTLLQGITRDAILTLADDMGLKSREQPIPREDLYTADELFFTGTASEVTPIRSVDRITIGDGKMGPVTAQIQERFLAIVRGEAEDPHGWRTLV